MHHLDDPIPPGVVPTGFAVSSPLLTWIENPWRRHMLRIHLNIVATGAVSSSQADAYISGLSTLFETHNIESTMETIPSVMYIPRIYSRQDIDETQDARGLEWFTEEQAAMLNPSLFRSGLQMPILTASHIMQSGAAATVIASETPVDRRWHVIQEPYQMFPLPNINMRDIDKNWGMLPLLVPGAHVVAPINLLQLARKVDGVFEFRLGYANSARVLVSNFNAWYEQAKKKGLVVSIHRLHPHDIQVLVENEIAACSRTEEQEDGRWLGPFDHFAAREVTELLLSSGVRIGKQENLHQSDSWMLQIQGAIASMRHHFLQQWTSYFSTSWMGGSTFELNPVGLKMREVAASLGELGLRRLRKNHDPSFWLEQVQSCKGSFAELQLWYGQLEDSRTYDEEAALVAEIGPYPLGRFVSEWGQLAGLGRWLEDADGEVVELENGRHYKMEIFSNRPSKKVFCLRETNKTSPKKFESPNVSLTFLEWLRKVEAVFEVGSKDGKPAFRRRGGSWNEFKSREDLRTLLGKIDDSNFLERLYESSLLPKQWNLELQSVLIEILGLVLWQWDAPFAPVCVHQFIEAVREMLGFRDTGTWSETQEAVHNIAGAQLDYLIDIWWPETFVVYRTELSWVLEMDHGVGLVASRKDGDDRIHATVGYETVRFACGLPTKIGWAKHKGGLVIGTDSLELVFPAPSAQTALRLARPHCAAEAWASSDLKDLLASTLGVTFQFHLGDQGTLPVIELRGPKRRLRSILRLIPGFNAGPVGYVPPPALVQEERRTGQCWVWTQAQLRGLAATYCSQLYEKVGITWDGRTKVLARAAADAVVVWGVVEHGLKCSVTAGGEWLPESRRAENGFCWDQNLELGPVSAAHHSGADVFLLATSDKALHWKNCVVSRGGENPGLDRIRLTPKGSTTIVSVGSGERPDGAFQRPLMRVEVGALSEQKSDGNTGQGSTTS